MGDASMMAWSRLFSQTVTLLRLRLTACWKNSQELASVFAIGFGPICSASAEKQGHTRRGIGLCVCEEESVMAWKDKTVQLAGSTLRDSCHVCAFFHSIEDECRVLIPFAREGIEAGDRLSLLLDKHQREHRLRCMAEGGISIAAAQRTRQIDACRCEQAYVRDGRFDQDSMLALIETTLADGQRLGFGLTRVWAEMEWALEDLPGVHDLVEYEARLNEILPNYDNVVVCVYDITRFSASVVMDALRTHPLVIISGILQENPFYVPTEVFLDELRSRRVGGERDG
jgi:hypothetical protein